MTGQTPDWASGITQQVGALRRDVDRILLQVHGSDELHIEGLHQRIDRVEKLADKVGDEVRDIKNMINGFRSLLRGVAIGLGITSLTGLGTLAAVLSKLLEP